MSLLRITVVPSPYQVRENHLFYGSRQSVRDWSGILLERSGKRYSGKPDGFAGTPKDNVKLTINS